MKPKKGEELELKIDSLVYGGSGLASFDGFKIFVEDVAPGDTVRARMSKVKSGYGEAKVVELVQPSELRVEARCPHFSVCGGCKWQFLSYEEQLRVKEQQVRDSIERLGGLDPELVRPIVGNESPWYYRNKMELSFGPGPDDTVMLGFYPPGYHFEVFDLNACFLQSELLVEIVKKVRDFVNEKKIPFYHSDTHEGLLKTLTIREGKNTSEVMIILTTSTGIFDYVEEFKSLFSDDPRITSVYWNSVYQVQGQPTWTEENLLLGKESLTEVLLLEDGRRLEFDILPQAFFQTNTLQAQKLYSLAVEAAGLSGEEVVFDLYCGTGTIGLFCAHKAKEVVGIEINESAVESARGNARRNGITNVSFNLGSVEARLATLTQKPDVVIVDPPRAGLGEKVVETTAAFGAAKIVYVSCNPTTMARDLKQFATLGYVTESVQPVDMFPQTHHVECVTVLNHSSASSRV